MIPGSGSSLSFDGVVIGGGANGLAVAGYMAKSGHHVAVVERNSRFGGGIHSEEVTLPGFMHNLCANFYIDLQNGPVSRDLEFEKFGVRMICPEKQTGIAFRKNAICVHRKPEPTMRSIGRFSSKDAQQYGRFYEKYAVRLRPFSRALVYNLPLPPDDLKKAIRSKLGEEYLTYGDISLRQALNESFEDEGVRTLYDTLYYVLAYQDDRQPFTGSLLLSMISLFDNTYLVGGGPRNLALALGRIITSNGGEILTGSHVDRIVVKDGEAKGVVLKDGTKIEAKKFVVSAVDFPQTIRMAGAENFDASVVAKAKNWKWANKSLVTIHVALDEPVDFGAAKVEPDVNYAFQLCWGPENMNELDAGLLQLKQGKLPDVVIGNGSCNTRFDPSYAPPGKHVAFWWPFAPYNIEGNGPTRWDDIRDEYAERLLDAWSEFAPNIKRTVLKKYLDTPLDVERRNINMGMGSVHVGAYIPEQLGYKRPHETLSQYRTPIKGLYLASGSSYPGGGMRFAPAYNCVNVLAEDMGIKKWWTPIKGLLAE